MSKRCSKPNSVLYVGGLMLKMRKMKVELNELRYDTEQNAEHRTEHLLLRIALLEFRNAMLCDELAISQEKLAELRTTLQTWSNPALKLYVSHPNRMLPVVAGMKEYVAAA